MAENKIPVVGEPSGAYKAVQMAAASKAYGEAIADAVRALKGLSPDQLEEAGITKEGKLTAEGVRNYVNRIARELIGAHFGDPNNFDYLPQYPQISNVVSQMGAKGVSTDLVEALAGLYVNIATNQVSQKDQAMVAAMSTEDAKSTTKRIAGLTGNEAYTGWIDDASDATEVAGRKTQLEGDLRETVAKADRTNTLDDLLQRAA